MSKKVKKVEAVQEYYNFTFTLRGRGRNADEAWHDAVEAFSGDPGPTPDEFDKDDGDEA